MDINQNNTVGGVPAGESDPWPSVGGAVSFGTYRTLGSAINWSNLVPSSGCPSVEGENQLTAEWSGSNATNNELYSWFASVRGWTKGNVFDAYSTPTCSAFNVLLTPSQPCAASPGSG